VSAASLQRTTRGRTRPGRLRALDAYLLRFEAPLLAQGSGPFIDLGFGETPATTLEAAAAFRQLDPVLEVHGLEIDPLRLQAAARHQDARTHFQLGGFERLTSLGPARLIRAMNVLRGYRTEELAPAHEALGAALSQGGLAVEGSADPDGGLLTCHLLRKKPTGEVHREALLFFTAFERGFAPLQFRDWLPRDLRRRVLPGEPIHTLLKQWTDAWEATRSTQPTPQRAFSASVQTLAALGEVAADPWLWESGYLLWHPAGGIPP